uniref:Uncharacterized protein n=1 Tax=Oryza rufipogon TaxID=4529 RepID=A0A0E0PWI8_ORYRU
MFCLGRPTSNKSIGLLSHRLIPHHLLSPASLVCATSSPPCSFAHADSSLPPTSLVPPPPPDPRRQHPPQLFGFLDVDSSLIPVEAHYPCYAIAYDVIDFTDHFFSSS